VYLCYAWNEPALRGCYAEEVKLIYCYNCTSRVPSCFRTDFIETGTPTVANCLCCKVFIGNCRQGRREGGTRGTYPPSPEIPMLKKLGVLGQQIIAMVISIYVFSFWGLCPQTSTWALPRESGFGTPLGDFCPQSPCFVPLRNKFLSTPCLSPLAIYSQ